MSAPEGWRLPYARRLREATGVPVIGVGQIRLPETAEQALIDGDCDFVALGRPSLADPAWPNKAAAGRPGTIRPCTTCNFCIAPENLHRICCAENPRAGRELDAPIPSTLGAGRSAIVIGAGPGGMSAALMLSSAGFETDIYEARSTVGGGLIASGAPPGKELLLRYRDYLERQLDASAVRQHRGVATTAAAVAKAAPDVTIIATGTRNRLHPIEGLDDPMVVEAYDLLMGDTDVRFAPDEHVVVYGGGETGCETAEFAAAQGALVTLVTRSRADQLARSAETVYRMNLIRRLTAHDRITVIERHHVLRVGQTNVTVADIDGATRDIAAHRLLLAQGRDPNRELADTLVAQGLSCHLVGDSRRGGRIGNAVQDSYQAMRGIQARYMPTEAAEC